MYLDCLFHRRCYYLENINLKTKECKRSKTTKRCIYNFGPITYYQDHNKIYAECQTSFPITAFGFITKVNHLDAITFNYHLDEGTLYDNWKNNIFPISNWKSLTQVCYFRDQSLDANNDRPLNLVTAVIDIENNLYEYNRKMNRLTFLGKADQAFYLGINLLIRQGRDLYTSKIKLTSDAKRIVSTYNHRALIEMLNGDLYEYRKDSNILATQHSEGELVMREDDGFWTRKLLGKYALKNKLYAWDGFDIIQTVYK